MPHRLVTPADILAAASWRLAAWPQERIEAGKAIVADLLAHDVALDEEEPAVEKAMALIADDGRDPWGALCALASAAERAVEKTIEPDPAGLGKDLARLVKTTFGLNFMPQAIAPLYEQAANRNHFTGARIETPGMENVQPFLRAKPGTSETMRELGMATRNLPEAVQVNPARTEALLRGYFNTWALYGLNLADAALYGDKLPEKRLDEYPVVRRFYADRPAIHTRHETMFYELLGEAHRLHGTLRALDRMGRQDIADEKEGEDLASHARQLERANKRAQSIAAEMVAVRRSDAAPTMKRQLLDALTVERNALMKATVEEVKPR